MFALLTVAATVQGNYNNGGGFLIITVIIYFFIDDEARPTKIKIEKHAAPTTAYDLPKTEAQKNTEQREIIKDKLARLKEKQRYWEAKMADTEQ